MEEKRESLSTERPERRTQARYAVDDCATLQLLNHGSSLAGQIIELSLDGCRLRMAREFHAGASIRVEVVFKIHGIGFRLSGTIQWGDSKNSVGIRFGMMTARRREELAELLAEVEFDRAAKVLEAEARRVAAEKLENERLVAEQLNRDKLIQKKLADESAVILLHAKAALIEPTQTHGFSSPGITSPVSLAVAKEPTGPKNQRLDSRPPVAPVASQRERRAQLRHSVDTTATIFLVDVASRSAGRVLDVSEGGCRIRTNERFPVGIYRRVEVEFVLDGLPFRLGGVTQSLHDKQSVGVRFLDLSERKREQLRQLVKEIESMSQDHSQE